MTDGAQADRQLPAAEEIFLDHIGHFVRDPEAAREALTRAGFAPTPISIQTQPDPAGGGPRLTGTGNVTAMLTRGYVEVLFKTADTPLGQELDAALARHTGVHLVAFAVADAARAHQRLLRGGFRVRPLVHMQRPVETEASQTPSPRLRGEGRGEGELPNNIEAPSPGASRRPLPANGERLRPPPHSGESDRSELVGGTAAFTVTRLEPGEMPEGRIQLLTHHTEALVWQPRWLSHPNGGLGLENVLIAVRDPEEAAQRFARLTGRPARAFAGGKSIALDRGGVDLMTAAAFAQAFPRIPIPSLPFIGAYRIRVASLERAERCLQRGGLKPQRAGSDLFCAFPRELGCGTWIFSCAGADEGPR